MEALLERYVMFLEPSGHRGDIMIEARGGKEDTKLNEIYAYFRKFGSDNVSPTQWDMRMTSTQLKLKRKEANIAGLQLADLLAYPSQREILVNRGLIEDGQSAFSKAICNILREQKYRRSQSSKVIEGYGIKFLP